MSTKAVKEVLVANTIAEIDLLKKGEINKANEYLVTRITATDKLWVCENFDTPGNEELIEYVWEQVKELTLLLTDSTNKEGITCLGSMPTQDPVIPCDEYVLPVVTYDLGLTLNYLGESGIDDGFVGSFDIDGFTYALPDYTKFFQDTYPLEAGVHNFDFTGMVFRRDGNNQQYILEYRVGTGAWTEAPAKTFSVEITNADISVEVRGTEFIPPSEYNVNVDLEYIGGADANDGFIGSFSIDGSVKPLDAFTKNFYQTYVLSIATHEFDFNGMDFYVDGLPVAYDLEYRIGGGAWTPEATKIFDVEVVDADVNVFVRATEQPPAEYNLNFQLDYIGGSDANDGLSGGFSLNGVSESLADYTKNLQKTYFNLIEGTQTFNFTNMTYMEDGVSVPYNLEYRIGIGGTWTEEATKIVNIELTEELDVFFRASVVPPVTWNVSSSMTYIGGSDAFDGLGGSFTVDIYSETVTDYTKARGDVYELEDGNYTFDYSNIIYYDDGVSTPFLLRYRIDGGAWTESPTKTIDVVVSGADVSLITEFYLEDFQVTTDITYIGDSDVGDGFTGSYFIDALEIPVSSPYTQQIVTVGDLSYGNHTWDLNGMVYNEETVPTAANWRYKIGTGGAWVDIPTKIFTIPITGITEIYIEAEAVPPPSYSLNLEIVYNGTPGEQNGLQGSYNIDGDDYIYPTPYTTLVQAQYSQAIGNHFVEFTLTEFLVGGNPELYDIEYRLSPVDPWILITGSTVPYDIVDSDVNLFIRLTQSVGP